MPRSASAGVEALAAALRARCVPHLLDAYSGDHRNRIGVRLRQIERTWMAARGLRISPLEGVSSATSVLRSLAPSLPAAARLLRRG